MTPLHYAAKNGYNGVMELLLKAGSNVNEQDTFGWTPLHFATCFGRIEAIKALLKEGVDLSLKTKRGTIPRDLATDENVIHLLKDAEQATLQAEVSSISNEAGSKFYGSGENVLHSTKGNKLPIITASAGLLLGLSIAYLAGAATLTPVGAVVAVFFAAAVGGALVGYGIGKFYEKVSSKLSDVSTGHSKLELLANSNC